MLHWTKIAFALVAPLFLASCVLQPGKFESTLTVNADRSFTFSYVGEVIAADVKGGMMSGFSGKETGSTEDVDKDPAEIEKERQKKLAADQKRESLAKLLAKEPGYRSVSYNGDDTFQIDYQISGNLDHHFLFPFNLDAEILIPFLMVELRKDDRVRVKAPGFAVEQNASKMGPPNKGESKLDGVFTLVTDAEIVSQNNEDGYKKSGGKKSITWRVNPHTKDAPFAILQMTR